MTVCVCVCKITVCIMDAGVTDVIWWVCGLTFFFFSNLIFAVVAVVLFSCSIFIIPFSNTHLFSFIQIPH